MAADIVQAKAAQVLAEWPCRRFVNGELDELDPIEARRWRQCRCSGFGLCHQQRAQSVARDQPRRRGAEFIVEYFQRQRPTITGGERSAQEVGDRQLTLAWKIPEVAAPGK